MVGEWLGIGPVFPTRHMGVLWAGEREAATRDSSGVSPHTGVGPLGPWSQLRARPPAGREQLGQEEPCPQQTAEPEAGEATAGEGQRAQQHPSLQVPQGALQEPPAAKLT